MTITPADRAALLERRKSEYHAAHPNAPDFAMLSGYCLGCGADLVAQHENYPTAFVTGCRRCHRSFCD